MTKRELEQIPVLETEIRLLQDELNNLPYTRDSVRGSMLDYPYIAHTIVIAGVDEQRGDQFRAKLDRKLAELLREVARMEDWLDGVEDAEMRVILRMKYRNEMTQSEIGKELGYDRSVISRKLNNFWKETGCTQNTF